MKNLFEKLFKKEPEFSYTIAEYMPIKVNKRRADNAATEYDLNSQADTDEMQIDKIYNRL